MKQGKFKGLFLVIIGVLAVDLIGLSGCAGSTDDVTSPIIETLKPPIEVTVDQLYEEYTADEAAADAKYKGQRLLFNEVEVAKVRRQNYTDRHGDTYLLSLYFMTGPVKFKLRDFGIMQNIKEGYVLNIVGECRGLLKDFIIIEDCWVESIIGDIGTSGFVDIY